MVMLNPKKTKSKTKSEKPKKAECEFTIPPYTIHLIMTLEELEKLKNLKIK